MVLNIKLYFSYNFVTFLAIIREREREREREGGREGGREGRREGGREGGERERERERERGCERKRGCRQHDMVHVYTVCTLYIT